MRIAKLTKDMKNIPVIAPARPQYKTRYVDEAPFDEHWKPVDITVESYTEKDAKVAYELIKGREQKSQEYYDTLPLALMMDALKPSQGVQSEDEEKPMSRPEDEGKEHG